MENKIVYGLKNVHYAKITNTEGVITYQKPVPLPGAVSMSLSKNYNRTPIAADDDPEYAVVIDNQGYSGDLNVTNIPQSFYTDCLGFVVEGGTLVESAESKAAYFALLFEFDGDNAKRRHILYNCLATPHNIDAETKGSSSAPKTLAIPITATKAKDTGIIKRSTISTDGDVYDDWFDEVQLSGGAEDEEQGEQEQGEQE